jgi:hypothetical protein
MKELIITLLYIHGAKRIVTRLLQIPHIQERLCQSRDSLDLLNKIKVVEDITKDDFMDIFYDDDVL